MELVFQGGQREAEHVGGSTALDAFDVAEDQDFAEPRWVPRKVERPAEERVPALVEVGKCFGAFWSGHVRPPKLVANRFIQTPSYGESHE